MTLVEVLLAVAVIAVVTAASMAGMKVLESARLRRSAVMIAGAIRIAYGHANATSKPVRLVFDFEQRIIMLEESDSPTLVTVKNDKTGGAQGATEAEREAVAEAESIMKGPRAPRPAFRTAKAYGFSPDKDKPGKELERGVRLFQVETQHSDAAERTQRAYLYFWPGGQTERAAIQLTKSMEDDPSDDDTLTILVSPLTGRAQIKKGRQAMVRPRDDVEESERYDSGY